MASNPAVLTSLSPAANVGGSSVAVPPVPGSTASPSIGGNSNPFLPTPVSGQAAPPLTNPSLPASTTSGTNLGNTNIYSGLFGGGQNKQGIIKGLEKTGIPGGVAALLAEFLMSGAGFNPDVAKALFNAMGPQIERGTENLAEQFSASGNRFGSPAATAMGDFMGQVNLNMDEILSNLYETSVQNYMSILMGAGKKAPTFGSNFMQSLGANLGAGVAGLVTG